MNNKTNLLSALYQNAEMGCSSIEKIIPKIGDKDLRRDVMNQINHYRTTYNNVCSQLRADKTPPKQLNPITKLSTDLGITMSCAKSTESKDLAKMLIQGTNMGIIRINQSLNKCQEDVPPKIIKEAKDMLTAEQAYIDKLTPYL